MPLLKSPRFLNGIEGKLISAELDGKYLLLSSESCIWKYDQEEGVITDSWFTNSFEKITSGLKVIQDGEYEVVVNGNRVLRWDPSLSIKSLDSLSPYKVVDRSTIKSRLLLESKVFWISQDGRLISKDFESDALFPPEFQLVKSFVSYPDKAIVIFKKGGLFYSRTFVLFRDESDLDKCRFKPSSSQKDLGSDIKDILHLSDSLIILKKNIALKVSLASSKDEDSREITLPNDVTLDCNEASLAPLESGHLVLACKGKKDGCSLLLYNVSFGEPILLFRLDVKSLTAPLSALGNKVFLQHGPRVAIVVADDLPRSLAGLISANGSATRELVLKEEEEDHSPVQLYKVLPPLLISGDIVSVSKIFKSAEDVPELLVLAALEVYLTNSELFPSVEDFQDSMLKVLSVPITESLMLPLVKKMEFSLAKQLLRFIRVALNLDTNPDNHLKWVSLIIGAHYVNFQLSRDEESPELLSEILAILVEFERTENEFFSILPIVELIKNKKMFGSSNHNSNSSYCIEVIEI